MTLVGFLYLFASGSHSWLPYRPLRYFCRGGFLTYKYSDKRLCLLFCAFDPPLNLPPHAGGELLAVYVPSLNSAGRGSCTVRPQSASFADPGRVAAKQPGGVKKQPNVCGFETRPDTAMPCPYPLIASCRDTALPCPGIFSRNGVSQP